MKYLLPAGICIFLIIFSGLTIAGCSKSPAVLETEAISSDYPDSDYPDIERQRSTLFVALEKPSNKYPIAAGIYYPWNEEQAEIPVRYYRARCWPGCHSGSSTGLYPDKKLDYLPVYMTSQIDNLEEDLIQE